ncbi:MAG: helix-turn-helix domain-containing protein [Desulfococcaceae bacterium]
MDKDNIIKPDWFDSWFSRHFPESVSQFSPKEIASGFGVSLTSIYRRVRTGDLGAVQLNGFSSSIIIPRASVYEFALKCYTLNN